MVLIVLGWITVGTNLGGQTRIGATVSSARPDNDANSRRCVSTKGKCSGPIVSAGQTFCQGFRPAGRVHRDETGPGLPKVLTACYT